MFAGRWIGGAAQTFVVARQHGPTVFGQVPQEFELAGDERFGTAETREVGFAQLGDHADLGPNQFGQGVDLAGAAGGDFEHRIAVTRCQLEQAQRHAEMIVVIARAGRTVERVTQNGMDHLPRGGLADTAGHGHDPAGESLAIPGGQSSQCGRRVVDLQAPAARRRLNVAAGHDHARRPTGVGVFGKAAAVVLRACQAPEGVTRFDLPAIDDDSADRRGLSGRRRQCGHPQAAADDLVQLGNC